MGRGHRVWSGVLLSWILRLEKSIQSKEHIKSNRERFVRMLCCRRFFPWELGFSARKRTETLRRVCVGSASRLRRFRSREACPIRFKWATRVFSWNIYARDYLGCFHGEEIGDTQSGGRPRGQVLLHTSQVQSLVPRRYTGAHIHACAFLVYIGRRFGCGGPVFNDVVRFLLWYMKFRGSLVIAEESFCSIGPKAAMRAAPRSLATLQYKLRLPALWPASGAIRTLAVAIVLPYATCTGRAF